MLCSNRTTDSHRREQEIIFKKSSVAADSLETEFIAKTVLPKMSIQDRRRPGKDDLSSYNVL